MDYFDDKGKPRRPLPHLDLREFQDDVSAWSEHNFPPKHPEASAVINCAGLAEEVGELIRACLKSYQGIRGTKEEWRQEAKKETGDVLVKIATIAGEMGFSLSAAVETRWAEVRLRDFQRNKIGHGLPEGSDSEFSHREQQMLREIEILENELMDNSVKPEYERGLADGDSTATSVLRRIMRLPDGVNPYDILRDQYGPIEHTEPDEDLPTEPQGEIQI